MIFRSIIWFENGDDDDFSVAVAIITAGIVAKDIKLDKETQKDVNTVLFP